MIILMMTIDITLYDSGSRYARKHRRLALESQTRGDPKYSVGPTSDSASTAASGQVPPPHRHHESPYGQCKISPRFLVLESHFAYFIGFSADCHHANHSIHFDS